MKKVLYFDCETTGVDPVKNGIIQIAFVVEIDGVVVEQKEFKARPFPSDLIEETALEVNGITKEQLMNYPKPFDMYDDILKMLDRHCDKFDRTDKFYPAGYNVRFDVNFLAEFFRKCGSKYGIGTYINWKCVDPFPLMHMLDYAGKIALPDYKLQTVCNHFGVNLANAHDAVSDVLATRELISIMIKYLMKE